MNVNQINIKIKEYMSICGKGEEIKGKTLRRAMEGKRKKIIIIIIHRFVCCFE